MACTKTATQNTGPLFLDSRRYRTDCCAKETKDTQNENISQYTFYNSFLLPEKCTSPNMRSPDFQYDHVNLRAKIGVGLADDCLIDQYSYLRNNPEQLTRDRCHIQLYTRIFQACPNLRPGVVDPDQEMPLLQGTSSTSLEGVKYPCKKTLMEMQTVHPTPLISCMQDIQDPKHIIEEKWVRGGDSTRDFVRRLEFMKKCSAQDQLKQHNGRLG